MPAPTTVMVSACMVADSSVALGDALAPRVGAALSVPSLRMRMTCVPEVSRSGLTRWP